MPLIVPLSEWTGRFQRSVGFVVYSLKLLPIQRANSAIADLRGEKGGIEAVQVPPQMNSFDVSQMDVITDREMRHRAAEKLVSEPPGDINFSGTRAPAIQMVWSLCAHFGGIQFPKTAGVRFKLHSKRVHRPLVDSGRVAGPHEADRGFRAKFPISQHK